MKSREDWTLKYFSNYLDNFWQINLRVLSTGVTLILTIVTIIIIVIFIVLILMKIDL